MTTSHKLSDVLQFIRGVTFSPEELVAGDASGAIACMRTKNIQKELDDSDLIYVPASVVKREELALQEGDLLISSANSWELVGKTVRVGKLSYPATAGGFISILRPDRERIDPDYLFRFISWARTQHEIRHLGRQTTNISNLDRERFLELPIPLPPLPTQRHIAKALDQADSLRRQAQQMEAELDRLAQALFLEMFGDPVGNPKGWPIVRLGQHLEAIESGWSPTCSEQQAAPGEWGVLKLGAVTSCTYRESENKKLPDELSPRLKLEVKTGDLLFSRKNTYALVAASAYVRKTQGKIMLSDLIFRLVPGKMLSPIYLWGLLVNPSFRSEVQSLAGGAAGSMPNISKAKLGGKEIPLPPVEAQEQYAGAVQRLWEQLDLHRQRADQLDCLFNALMQRAFKGELTPKLA